MEPICLFSLFANSHKVQEHGIDLLKVHDRVEVLTVKSVTEALSSVPQTLYTQVFADEGSHSLLITHKGSPRTLLTTFDILPEQKFAFLVVSKGDFPIRIHQDPIINEYPLILDGEYLATAYLLVHSL